MVPSSCGGWLSEQLERFVLRRGGEGEVAGIVQEPVALDDAVDLVLEGVVVVRVSGVPEGGRHGAGGAAALAGVGLVDDDGELAAAVFVADGTVDDDELLDRGDDDLLALGDVLAQLGRGLSVGDCAPDLGEGLDGVVDLLVQHPAVGDDDDGVEDDLRVLC